jgi:predicted outer membrane repeat protein
MLVGEFEQFDDGARGASRRSRVRAAGELVITTGTVLGVVGGTLVGASAPAGAIPTDHVVDSLTDDGTGLTLREAIADAVAGDTISFDLPAGSTIALTQGELLVDKALTITGPGAELLTIQADEATRAFYLYSDADAPVTISGLTITGGSVDGNGGGMLAREALTLDDVTLSGNQATGNGGGLSVEGASLVMTDSTLSGNTASIGGGASAFGAGSVSIATSVISGNQAVDTFENGKYLGGGIFLGQNFVAEISETTISGNTSDGGGGGIAQADYLYGAGGAQADGPVEAAAMGNVLIDRTTISGNDAQGSSFSGPQGGGGGGVWVGPGATDVRLLNSTVSGNTAPNGAGGGVYAPFGQVFNGKYVSLDHSTVVGNSAAQGGGVAGDYSYANPDRFTIQSVVDGEYASSHVSAYHTIVGNNSATDFGSDVAGGLEVRWSLVENTNDGTVIDEGGTNIFNRDPQLGALADNGGPTRTHLPNAGSPVVDAGDPNPEPPETDQRGEDRVQGSRIDIGSVEGFGQASLPPGPCADAPQNAFTDVTGSNVHHAAVDCLAYMGIAKGGPEGMSDDRYGPALDVTRGQMAGFLARLIEKSGTALPTGAPDAFHDDDGSTHEAAINALAAAGIVEGFDDGTYRPGDPVRRDQMASFLLRTHDYISIVTLPAGADAFDDDEPGNVHEAAINALAAAGVIEGTATPRVYDPSGDVRRDQMASFLIRLAQLLYSEGEFPINV